MPIPTDIQEIHKTVMSFDDDLNQRFYETQNSRTTSSTDCYSYDMVYWNFRSNQKSVRANYIQNKLQKKAAI